MNVVFLGTPGIAVPSLEALREAGHHVALVICQPDRPVGRSARPVAPAVKEAALAAGLDVEQPVRVRDAAFLDLVASRRPDVLVVVAYGRILPAAVLAAPSAGPVNVHFSLLPRGRGAAPVQWTLAWGDELSGVTTMLMNERLDEGDLLLQRELPVAPGEHAPELQARLARLGAELLVETLRGLAAGTLRPRPQEHSLATYAPPLRKDDGRADFALPARAIEGRVRGFDPWPGVWARKGERRIRIARARARSGALTEAPPGTVLVLADGGIAVACGGGSVLELLAVQPEGRKAISAADALRGRVLAAGDRLEGNATEV